MAGGGGGKQVSSLVLTPCQPRRLDGAGGGGGGGAESKSVSKYFGFLRPVREKKRAESKSVSILVFYAQSGRKKGLKVSQ